MIVWKNHTKLAKPFHTYTRQNYIEQSVLAGLCGKVYIFDTMHAHVEAHVETTGGSSMW